MHKLVKDLTGRRFGHWTVLCYVGARDQGKKYRASYWLCRCDCGTERAVLSKSLKKGFSTNCGCQNIGPQVDLTGHRFGRLTVLRYSGCQVKHYGRVHHWLCRCDCGTKTVVIGGSSIKARSCGCIRLEKVREAISYPDLITGQRFGRWTVLSRANDRVSKKGVRHKRWLCRCDCGTERLVAGAALRATLRGRRSRSNGSQSCGCLSREAVSKRHKGVPNPHTRKHGLSNSPEMRSWQSMITRCTNPKHHAWNLYGGRGIKVCDRWRFGENGKSGIECFYADMGPRPRGHSIHRIDGDGNYEPGNCKWATFREQVRAREMIIVTESLKPLPPLSGHRVTMTNDFSIMNQGFTTIEAAVIQAEKWRKEWPQASITIEVANNVS